MEHIQLLRIKKLKGSGIINIATRHNLREIQAEIGADSHIDPLKTAHNVILRGAGIAAEVAKEAASLMEQGKVKPLRKDAVLGLEMLVSLPASSGIDEQAFFRDSIAWAEGFFEIPILSAVIHNDEAAPHCHVIMLPLFDGRMIGNGLLGNKARLLAIQADFHAKVGQVYGLKRGAPAKRYSRAARASAADRVVSALRRSPNALDDPAIRDALFDELVETMQVRLIELLGLDVPEVKAQQVKPANPIVFERKKAIVFDEVISAPKDQTLSCVVFVDSPSLIQPADTSQSSNQDEYVREREEDQPADNWDIDIGEHIRPPTKTKMHQVKVETMRSALAGIAAKKRSYEART